jgi:hypothetical protein
MSDQQVGEPIYLYGFENKHGGGVGWPGGASFEDTKRAMQRVRDSGEHSQAVRWYVTEVTYWRRRRRVWDEDA